jgi:hypothetical protein
MEYGPQGTGKMYGRGLGEINFSVSHFFEYIYLFDVIAVITGRKAQVY